MVECDLAKVEVAGSTPVSRSTRMAAWPSGKATACKAVILQFKSGSRLQKKIKGLERFLKTLFSFRGLRQSRRPPQKNYSIIFALDKME